jgi:hypothetical protein
MYVNARVFVSVQTLTGMYLSEIVNLNKEILNTNSHNVLEFIILLFYL